MLNSHYKSLNTSKVCIGAERYDNFTINSSALTIEVIQGVTIEENHQRSFGKIMFYVQYNVVNIDYERHLDMISCI
jgi:hypothetical protein